MGWPLSSIAVLTKQVVSKGLRPLFPPGSHEGYVHLAQSCWDAVPSQRPNFDEIVATLNEFLIS